MKIGIDISQIAYKGTGVGRFTTGLVNAILKYNKTHEFHFFFSSYRNSPPTLELPSELFHLHRAKLPPTVLEILWNRLHIVPVEKFAGELDWFITSDWTEPPAHCKKATIVHDLVFKRYPETVTQKILSVQTSRLEWVKKEATMVFADSVSTKNDLQELLGFDEQKVIVAYPGVEDIEISDIDLEHTKNKFQLKPNYILAVGKVEPRKNLQRLIEAFDLLENTDTELVIVGPPGWASIDHTVKNVRFLGYVSDQELYALYHLANFFIFPSLYEGFGYPLVEAMKIGCPTAASNTSSLKEIGENASLLFDPTNVDDIKNALETLTNDKELCQELVTKGRKKAHEYTWKRYYDELITSLERYT